MKNENCPISPEFIIENLKNNKDCFRKANGSKYNNDFNKVIYSTLRSSGYFYKNDDDKYFYKIEKFNELNIKINSRKIKKELKKNILSNKKNIVFNLKSKKELLPLEVKIKVHRVNKIIEKLRNKYKGNLKYKPIILCLNLFNELIKKFLYLVKMNKTNSLYDLTILNDKIISICQKIEKMEKNEIFFPQIETICKKFINENKQINEVNINNFDGCNNQFSEPPTLKKKKIK